MNLYAYEMPELVKYRDWLKIGQTVGDVEKRINEQGREHNLTNVCVWKGTGLVGKREITDKNIHRRLIELGFEIDVHDNSGLDTEWIKCTVADVE